VKQNHSGSSSKNKEPEDIAKSRRFEESFKNNASNRFEKELIPLAAIQPYLKDYKFDGNESLAPYYTAYNKKTSKQVIVKYSTGSMDQQKEVYNRLWKNIVKARWPCINKIYEMFEPNVNIMVMDKNVSGIRSVAFDKVLVDILKILEFLHECGYLYRNMSPEHFMLTAEEYKLVVIDFKLARRYTDIKGNHIDVQETVYRGGDFGSNSQLRHMPEGRKDDLESLGYLALFLLSGELPWQGMSR
jgi:serine/threonine protein kinase